MFRILRSLKYFTNVIMAVSFVIFSPVHAHAVTFELYSGQIVEGEIIQQDADSFKLDTGIGFPITYFIDEIKLIDGKPVSPSAGSDVEEQATDVIEEKIIMDTPPPTTETIPEIEFKPEPESELISELISEAEPEVDVKPVVEVKQEPEGVEDLTREENLNIINLEEIIADDFKPAEELLPMTEVVSEEIHQMLIKNGAVEVDQKQGLRDGPRSPYNENPIKDISVIESKEPLKEHPSPFGPTIKPRSEQAGGLDVDKQQEDYLVAEVMEDPIIDGNGAQYILGAGTSSNAIIRIIGHYIYTQKLRIRFARSELQKKMPFIKERLRQVPMRVRKDALIIITSLLGIIYILICYPMMNIARKIGKKHSWLVWIPIVQLVYYFHMAGKPLWWSLWLLIPVVNCLMLLFLFIDILRALKKPFWMVALILIPGANIIALWYLAMSKGVEIEIRKLMPGEI